MKKLMILLIALMAIGSIFATALSEGFESTTCPPVGWTISYANPSPPAGNLMIHDTSIFYGGARSFRFSSYSYGSPYDQYLITPQLEVTSGDQTVSFWYRSSSFDAEETFQVGWSSTDTAPGSFTWDTEIVNDLTTWTQYQKTDLPVGTKYVAIHYYSDYMYYMYVDTFAGPQVYVPPTPIFSLTPNVSSWDFAAVMISTYATKQFTIQNTGGGTLDLTSLSVTAGGTYYSISEAPADVSLTNMESTTFTVRYDAPATVGGPYAGNVAIVHSLGTTNIALSGSSYDPVIDTFPYTEGFDTVTAPALPQYWGVSEGAAGASQHWKTTTTAVHGPAAAASASNFAHLYCYLASTTYNPYSLITPPISLPVAPKRLVYKYWIGDDTVANPLFVDVSADLSTWTPLYTHSNSTNTLAWYQNIVDLTAYASSTVYLRFRGVSNYGSAMTDFGIDDVMIEDVPVGAPDPVTLVNPPADASGLPIAGFNFTWTPSITGGEADDYSIFISTDEFDVLGQFTATTTGTSLNPVGMPFEAGTFAFAYEQRYYWQVFANGAGEEVASEVRWFEIELDPTISVLPWAEGFEGATFPPSGWTSLDEDADDENWFQYSAASSAHSGTYSAGSASWTSTSGALTPDNWLITPPINIPATGEYLVEWYVGAQDPAFPAEKYGFYVSTTGTDPADFTQLFVETLEDGVWHYRSQPLADYAGDRVYFAFRHFDVTDQFYMKIDDVQVREVPQVPIFACTPTEWYFGTSHLMTPTIKTFTISNNGADTIDILEGDIVLNDPYGDFVLVANDLPVELSGTTTYSFTVSFIPQSTGVKNATISIDDNLAARVVNTIDLTGECVGEPIASILGLEAEVQTTNVTLGWSSIYGDLGNPGYLHWDDSIHRGSVGAGASLYDVAVKFGVEEMSAYTGMELTKVMIHVAAQPTAVDSLKIWSGSDAVLAPTATLRAQALTGIEVGWNEVVLNTPLTITGADAIYAGYHVTGVADTFPASTDALTAVPNRGNLVSLNGGAWTTLTAYSIAGNWLIHPYFDNAPAVLSHRPVAVVSTPVHNTPSTQLRNSNATLQYLPNPNTQRSLRGFNVYRDGLQINPALVAAYTYLDEALAPGIYDYTVQAVHYSQTGPMSDEVSAEVVYVAPLALPFLEDWTSGSMDTNYWVAGGANWVMETTEGNLTPCIKFSYSPSVEDYEIPLTSFGFDGTGFASVKLKFDISLDNYSVDYINYIHPEVWNGTTWNRVGTIPSSYDDFGWTTFSWDITPYAANREFKIRLMATGENSYYINYWYIDNIILELMPASLNTPVVTIIKGVDNINLSWPAIPGADWYAVRSSATPDGPFSLTGWVNGNEINLAPEALGFYEVTAGAGDMPIRGIRLDKPRPLLHKTSKK